MAKVLESQAVRSSNASDSLRTTVPAAVCVLLGVEAGDTLLWELVPGSTKVVVSRQDASKPSAAGASVPRKRSSEV